MAESAKKPRLSRHGTVRRYKQGCSCDPCTEANTEARRRERERKAIREGKAVPTAPKHVPTKRPSGPTKSRRSAAADDLVRIIEDALFEGNGALTAAAVAAANIREAGYRLVLDGPIEAAARKALAATGGGGDLAAFRRETVFRAASIMDNPKAVPFFRSAAEVMRATVGDLLAGQPPKDGEADALATIMASFGRSNGSGRGRRGAPSVDDPKESK